MTDTAIVTGGAGFLGSHLCEELLEDGYEVICVDNFGSGSIDNIEHLDSQSEFTLFEADIRKSPDLPPAGEIYHLASRASPKDFTDFPVEIALTNTEGTRFLLEHARKHDSKMLFASTSEVYGDPEVHPQPESYTGNVNIRGPRGCYDESKRFGETLTAAYHNGYNLDVRTVRIFNTYGPRMRSDDGRVVPTFIRQALSGENITVYGDGDQTRTFCYVDDTISGLKDVMDADDMAGEVINIGGENEITINTLATKILKICNSNSKIVHEQLPPDDPTQRRPDISKARSRLEWSPHIQLTDGLRKTIRSFEET